MGLIYKATNKLNGKAYIGQTIKTLEARKSTHKSAYKISHRLPFYAAIRKYGWDNFVWDILEDNIPIEYLAVKEVYYIGRYDTYVNGYNVTLDCNSITKATRKKISKSLKGRTPWNKGKTGIYSKATLKRMSKSKCVYTYLITFPNGKTQATNNLWQFCKDHNLTSTAMFRILKGKQKQHKGFSCQRL